MKMSFNEAIEVEETEATSQEKEIVKADSKAPAVASDTSEHGGEETSGDLQLPKLNLVNKSGDLADEFPPGAFVLNKELVLYEKDGPALTVVALGRFKQFRENLSYDDMEDRRVFNSIEEVKEAGGVLSWKRGEGNFSEMSHVDLLIRMPEGMDEDAQAHFYYPLDGHSYTRAIFTAAGTAHSEFAAPIYTATKTFLRAKGGYIGGFWSLTSAFKKNAKNSWWIPKLRTAGFTTDAFKKEVTETVLCPGE